MSFDFQRAHEEELEAERQHKVEMRFKPDVLYFLERIEKHTERLTEIGAEIEEIRTAVANLDNYIRFELPQQLAKDNPGKHPKALLYVIAILLAIIAFK